MDRVEEYLCIPGDYCRALGGLRWAVEGYVIEFHDGRTFAFAGEIAQFLEGIALQRPFPNFGHIVHLLDLLRTLREPRPKNLQRLPQLFRRAGQVHRNAGAFFGVLCPEVPDAPDVPTAEQVWQRIVVHCCVTGAEAVPRSRKGQEPSQSYAEFEESIDAALAAYTDEELLDWFRLGQGHVKEPARRIAERLDLDRPRSLRGTLAQIAQHDRLAGAIPYVAQMVSALTLPPRRLAQPELPLGGYSDVTTRGLPEQVLPSQLALDDLEFIRRHAQRELLYYRREEPHSQTREELVILLDQGVRTWGTVRLVLAATLLAFGQLADCRRMPFRVAVTSDGGRLHDPLAMPEEALAQLLQVSDLTARPALALERVLEEDPAGRRDIVLLTHPYKLEEADVLAAGRRLHPQARLFAVTVDGRSLVRLSELRHGAPLPVSQFQVDLEAGARQQSKERTDKGEEIQWTWTGDVELIGFPFRFGVERDPKPNFLFAFDHAGQWLLTANPHRMLHLTQTDGEATEVLPRGYVRGSVLQEVDSIIGVAGGFVVAGSVAGMLVALHYDVQSHCCRAHVLLDEGEVRQTAADKCEAKSYNRELHCVIFQYRDRDVALHHALDLTTGQVQGGRRTWDTGLRASRALERASRLPNRDSVLDVGGSHPSKTDYG
jgi:hypothetical protein